MGVALFMQQLAAAPVPASTIQNVSGFGSMFLKQAPIQGKGERFFPRRLIPEIRLAINRSHEIKIIFIE
jgi:hypothetical protein